MLNLLPWREQQQTKQKHIIICSCAGAFILATGSLAIWTNNLSQQIDRQNVQEKNLQRQLVLLKQQYPQLKATQTKLQAQNKNINMLGTLQQQQQKLLALLQQLSQLLPQQVHITKISKQTQIVTLFGAANNHQDILQFVADLKTKTELKPVLQEVQAKDYIHFRIQFEL